MKNLQTWLIKICVCCFTFLPLTSLAEGPAGVAAQSYILVEASTGRVIAEKDADVKKYPASMTKMMTAVLSLEKLRPDANVPILEDAALTEDCPLAYQEGDVFSRDELIRGMLMVSDNGAAVALADHVDGNVADFAKRMNEKAKNLGMTDTHFVNPNGLTSPIHYSTPRDMMKLARYAMHNETFRQMVAQPTSTIHWKTPAGRTQLVENTNELLNHYPGTIGIKTGWTSQSGGCLAAEAKRDDVDLLVVLMASPTQAGRFTDAQKLLDYGFSEVKIAKGISADETKTHIWVRNGQGALTTIKAVSDINYPLIHGEDASHYSLSYDIPTVVDAKVTQDDVVGHVIVSYDGQEVGRVDMKAEPVAPGFSLASWTVGMVANLLGY